MTEQEASEYMEELNKNYFQPDKPGEFDDVNEAFEVAMSALTEIQKYQALEERLEKVYGNCSGLLEKVVECLEKHEGVILPELIFKARLITDEEVDKWEAYKQLGTVEEVREAMEKQKAKEPILWSDMQDNEGTLGFEMYNCPNCGKSYERDYEEYAYCPKCGQAMERS